MAGKQETRQDIALKLRQVEVLQGQAEQKPVPQSRNKGEGRLQDARGASTGPRTPEGRQKCSQVKTMHGRDTRAIRAIRDETRRELRDLERFMKTEGMIN